MRRLPKIRGTILPPARSRRVRASAPEIPWEIRDEVIKWGREIGRNATIVWNRTLCANYGGCAEVRIELKPDDPRLRPWQEGELDEKPYEPVFFHRYDQKARHYKPIDIRQLGPSGVRAELEKGNMWSGRAEAGNILEAARNAREHNSKVQEKQFSEGMERVQARHRDHRRQLRGLPLVNVPEDVE